MLLIKTEVKPSRYGLGLFAAEFITEDTCIWTWDDRTEIVMSLHDAKSDIFEEFLSTYGYYVPEFGIVVNLDNARFMNHSDTPNGIEIDGSTYAKYDIQAGEELTCDYRIFDHGLTQCGEFLQK